MAADEQVPQDDAPTQRSASDERPTVRGLGEGQLVLGRFRLQKLLGKGGMGVVWLARDQSLGDEVALKFISELLKSDAVAVDDLKAETRKARQLTHSHIMRIHEFWEDAQAAAVSMEFVDGQNLSQLRLAQHGKIFDCERLAPWVAQLCAALDYAHQKARLVHRDLKPANLMIDARGDLKVADFGISAAISETTTRVSRRASSGFTETYASPQQLRGKAPVPTDDIYALGATLYELLTGKPPFYRGNILLQVEEEEAAPLNVRRTELGYEGRPIPKNWENIILACLAKDPKDRPQTAGEVWSRLQGVKVGAGMVVAPVAMTPQSVATAPAVSRELQAGRQTGQAPVKSRTRLMAALLVAGLALGGLGYFWGVHLPEQERIKEEARVAAAAREAAIQLRKAEEEQVAAKNRQIAEREQREYAVVVAKIDAAIDESAAVLITQTDTEVKKYLQTAPERFNSEVEARWSARRATWEAARLAAARGGLVVRTKPAGAEVRVGAVALDKSPLTLKDLKLGRYPVLIRLDGYEEWGGETEIKENEFNDLDVTLVRSTGTLVLTTEPAGLEAQILGALSSNPIQAVRTPVEVKLPTGAYRVTIRRPGWSEQTKAVEIARNQTVQSAVDFVGGSLELDSTPTGAEVWQDGKRIGVTPYRRSDIIPGRYGFELRLAGYKSFTKEVLVLARSTVRENMILEEWQGPDPGRSWTIPGLSLTMQFIAPGTFIMGSASGYADEKPLTQVVLTQAFWLGKTEVTQAQWQAVMGKNPSINKGDHLPVEHVSWDEAMEFGQKLTEQERAAGRLSDDYRYTVPTEAQWEYACRAGATSDTLGQLALLGWYSGNSGGVTHPVALKQANAWGLHDMHGNVWEWCANEYANYPGGTMTDPVGQEFASVRIVRGGSWTNGADDCRPACRLGFEENTQLNYIGLRIALVPEKGTMNSQGRNPFESSAAGSTKMITVRVTGAVKSPGFFSLPVGSSLQSALQQAGNVSAVANRKRVTITRAYAGATKVQQVDLDAGSQNILLQHGDEVNVPERLI